MENLNGFMKNQKLNTREENLLDTIVLKNMKPKRTQSSGLFYKFAITLFLLLIIGVGIFLLPETQQRKIVKPVSAQEILQQTYNKLQEMMNTPGIVHYRYNIKTESDYEEYDNFEIDSYVSNLDKKYLIQYGISKSDQIQLSEMIPGEQYRDFSPQEFAVFSDGINEYTYSYGDASNWRNLSEEMISIEHNSHLNSLVKFYDYLLQDDRSQYELTETKVNNVDVFVISFSYSGIALTTDANETTKRVESTYEGKITINKNTYLPISNETYSTFSSLQDRQVETYENIEVISADKANSIFDFSEYINNLESYNKNTSETPVIRTLGKGRFELKNPGEDIFTPVFIIGNKEYGLEGNLLFDKITRKPTIIGKFLIGKEIEAKGFIVQTNYGDVLWIDDIDYSELDLLNPSKTTQVKPTITPTNHNPTPPGKTFTGIVFDNEYGEGKENAIRISGILPSGLKYENNEGLTQSHIVIESEHIEFRIAEWYKAGFITAQEQPELLQTKNLGEVYMYDYSENTFYYFTPRSNYKTTDCKDYLGESISSPCINTIYPIQQSSRERYLSINCEIKSESLEALDLCKNIIKDLSIAKS
jgi:hypothetical protein